MTTLAVVISCMNGDGGNRKGGTSAHTGAKKCPGDTCLARGRFH